jgi:hypothetical protein
MRRRSRIKIFIFVISLVVTAKSEDSRLFWVDNSLGKIQSATPQGLYVTDVVTGLQSPEGIAIDTTSSPMKIYCTEAGADRIIRMNFDGTELEEVVTGISSMEDLTLDMINRKVYWLTDQYSEDKVQRADMDSLNSNIETVYTNNYAMHGFHGIAVHPDHQWVFWTQYVYGGLSRVNRINYDGTGRTTLCNYLSPRGIEVIGEKIYFIWGSADIIMQANLDGSEADTLLTGVDGHFFAMDTLLGQAFWTENSKLKCANLDNTGHLELITGLGYFLRGIALYYNPLSNLPNQENNLPKEFQLAQNYPNPFNPTTRISWQSPVDGWQTLKLYDILGGEVATLINKKLPAGWHEVVWDASGLAGGVYLYQLKTEGYVKTRKLVLMK